MNSDHDNSTMPVCLSGHCRPRPHKRGVLLLVVLSMLTLFLMLGAAYMLTTSRAWEAARAYSRLVLGTTENRIPHARLLDDVMLQALRGGPGVPESLLADKYGVQTFTGSMSGCAPVMVSGTQPQQLIVGTLQTGSSVQPTDLVGRVLTFAAAGRAPTSHRIVRAVNAAGPSNTATTAFSVTLDASTQKQAFTFPLATSAAVIINGREFSGDGSTVFPNESWDGFDRANDFLARIQPLPGSLAQSNVLKGSLLGTNSGLDFSLATSSSTSASFTLAGSATSTTVLLLTGTSDVDNDLIPDGADNDNDGVVDGAFRSFGLPPVVDANGNTIQLRASVLIVDLDGRFNLNAHDSLARILYSGSNLTSGTHANWPTAFASGTLHPLGSGYGPAEVDGSKLLTLNSGSSDPNERPLLQAVVGGSTSEQLGLRPTGSRYSVNTATPRLPNLTGRYGETLPTIALAPLLSNTYSLSSAPFPFPRPGAGNVDDAASRITDRLTNPSTAPTENYGVPPFWWLTGGTTAFNWAVTGTSFPSPRGTYNSPPDLHGRMKSDTIAASGTGIAPTLRFAKADWPTAADPVQEARDDPYEIQLDTRLGRGGYLPSPTVYANPTDNPFTPAELEPVLRPYDIDTWTLPPRLATMLGSAGEAARFLVTTDSWDTTAIVGGTDGAVGRVFGSGTTQGWLQLATTGTLAGTSAVTGLIGGEIARGEKLNLNRALPPASTATAGYNASSLYYVQRQAYFKDLYTLLVALEQGNDPAVLSTATAAKLAQWAANVVEFRDADSVMTPFEYDLNPRNGWAVDGDVTTADSGTERQVVWGVERPEILLRTTFAWKNTALSRFGMLISLHRPWQATAYASGTSIDAEPCDYAIDTLSSGTGGVPTNSIDLAKKPSNLVYAGTSSTYLDTSGTTYPIWRLRIVAGGTTYVRLDTSTAASDEFAIASVFPRPKMDTNSTLTLLSGTTIDTGTGTAPTVGSGTILPTYSGTAFTVTGLRVAGSATNGMVYLERLSDPSQQLLSTTSTGSTAWYSDPLVGGTTTTSPVRYLVVDSMPVAVAETQGLGIAVPSTADLVHHRSTSSTTSALWLTATSSVSAGTIPFNGNVTIPSNLSAGSTAWFPWNNRPFVSSAELMLVPQRDTLGILSAYQKPTPSNQATVGIPVPMRLLFDAVHVPTRFAGIHTTGTHALSGTTGIFNETTPVNQYSSFREPGRVNLNTVVSGTAPLNGVWNAVVAGRLATPLRSGSASDFAANPGRTLASLLALTGTSTTPAADTAANLPTLSSGTFNPAQEIYTATRLANTVTPRSNVFAMWVTLREAIPNDPDSVKYHRAFYIIDRSIPVGFEQGRDHNAMDCVRVRRIIE